MRALLTLVLVAIIAAGAQAQPRPQPNVTERIDRLDTWIAAGRAHVAGEPDAPLETVAAFRSSELAQIWVDLRSVLRIIEDPSIATFSLGVTGSSTRRTAVLYLRRELDRLRVIAKEAARDGGANGLLKRGALMHGDIAMLTPTTGSAPSWRSGDSGPRVVTVFMNDGQKTGIQNSIGQWEMAQMLLDAVTPAPAKDESVRLWYRATLAYMLLEQQYGLPHFERAIELFATDPDILFVSAALHEGLARPAVQAAVRDADLPPTHRLHLESRDSELRKAEKQYRQLLEIAPDDSAARLRHGHVLGLLRRHDEALAELRTAVPMTTRSTDRYAAWLFVGTAATALGHDDEARSAYARATELFPRAQSPRIGLSQLAIRRGEATAAASVIAALTLADEERDATDDPWWSYYLEPGRNTRDWLDAAARALRALP